jgi:hypothetical protein
LIDATYTPINHDHLSSQERNKRVLDGLPILEEELRGYMGLDTGVVLVKANVCTLLEPILNAHGFPILNRGRTIPFPSNGQQGKFREVVREVLDIRCRRISRSESPNCWPSETSANASTVADYTAASDPASS